MAIVELGSAGPGPGCSKCPTPFATKRVLVTAGSVVSVGGRPFHVGVDSEFFMCVRCRSFFIPQASAPVAVSASTAS